MKAFKRLDQINCNSHQHRANAILETNNITLNLKKIRKLRDPNSSSSFNTQSLILRKSVESREPLFQFYESGDGYEQHIEETKREKDDDEM